MVRNRRLDRKLCAFESPSDVSFLFSFSGSIVSQHSLTLSNWSQLMFSAVQSTVRGDLLPSGCTSSSISPSR
jgi:hypothetical protein